MEAERKVRVRPINRQQLLLRPVDVERLVGEDHAVRAVWEFVGLLDLGRFYAAIEALEATGPLGEAASYMGVTEQEFARYRTRLKQLGECFIAASEVPKQRKKYKKRNTVANEA